MWCWPFSRLLCPGPNEGLAPDAAGPLMHGRVSRTVEDRNSGFWKLSFTRCGRGRAPKQFPNRRKNSGGGRSAANGPPYRGGLSHRQRARTSRTAEFEAKFHVTVGPKTARLD